jgi:hypothetical protein
MCTVSTVTDKTFHICHCLEIKAFDTEIMSVFMTIGVQNYVYLVPIFHYLSPSGENQKEKSPVPIFFHVLIKIAYSDFSFFAKDLLPIMMRD